VQLGQENRHGCVFQHIAGRPPQDCLAEAGVAIGAHDDHAGICVGGMADQDIRDSRHGFAEHVNLTFDPLARQHLRQHAAGVRALWPMLRRVDHHNAHQIGAGEERYGLANGGHRLDAFVPGHQDGFWLANRLGIVGNNQNRSAAFKKCGLDHGFGFDTFALAIGLAQNNQIRKPRQSRHVAPHVGNLRDTRIG
jgi:hypothetical protein